MREYFGLSALFALVVGVVALTVQACSTVPTPKTPRERYAAAEVALKTAIDEVGTLRRAGMITPGSNTAVAVAKTISAASSALDVWSLNPDDPRYVEMGVAAVAQLATLINDLKRSKALLPDGRKMHAGPLWRYSHA